MLGARVGGSARSIPAGSPFGMDGTYRQQGPTGDTSFREG